MSMNLVHTNRAVDQAARAKADWHAMTACGDHAMVFIDDAIVTSIARVLEGARLANGETVGAYAYDRDDPSESHVSSFGPSLLDAATLELVRERLAKSEEGADRALKLLDTVVARGLQISFSGTTHIPAHAKGVNWPADDVAVNRSGGNMTAMLLDLGLDVKPGMGETDFATFAAAVEANGDATDYPGDRLRRFVECGRRQGATHVHWA